MKQSTLQIETYLYGGVEIRYVGTFPIERTIFLSGGKNMSKDGIINIFRSSLEAAYNGWNVSYIPGLSYSEAVERGVYLCDKGSLSAYLPRGIKSASKALISRCLVTGGGVVSTVDDNESFSIEALSSARSLAQSMAEATLVAGEGLSMIPLSLTSALDDGRSVAVMESAMNGKGMRNLIRDGAPIIRTFSDFLSSPRYISYADKKGKYGIMGERFSLMDMEKYE